MGGAFVCRERVLLQDLLKLVFEEQVKAEKLNLYLKSISCFACNDSAVIFNVLLEFSK